MTRNVSVGRSRLVGVQAVQSLRLRQQRPRIIEPPWVVSKPCSPVRMETTWRPSWRLSSRRAERLDHFVLRGLLFDQRADNRTFVNLCRSWIWRRSWRRKWMQQWRNCRLPLQRSGAGPSLVSLLVWRSAIAFMSCPQEPVMNSGPGCQESRGGNSVVECSANVLTSSLQTKSSVLKPSFFYACHTRLP